MKSLESLIEKINKDETIKRYRELEKIINENKNLKIKLNALKQLQKQLINVKKIDKKAAVIEVQKQYDDAYEEIQSYPLMTEYLNLQEEINDCVQYIVKVLEKGINEDLEALN